MLWLWIPSTCFIIYYIMAYVGSLKTMFHAPSKLIMLKFANLQSLGGYKSVNHDVNKSFDSCSPFCFASHCCAFCSPHQLPSHQPTPKEGVFEFLSKLRCSWPWAARNAWCCMLANPQHLNIGSMLLSPKTSPFALALQASKTVLVVANRHKSIYCRLWCGYEAGVSLRERSEKEYENEASTATARAARATASPLSKHRKY